MLSADTKCWLKMRARCLAPPATSLSDNAALHGRKYDLIRPSIFALLVTGLLTGPGIAAGRSQFDTDWQSWRTLPVQDGGRCKPLDSLARETLRLLANRTSFEDPDTGERLEPIALYMALLFDWQGWDASTDALADDPAKFYTHHKPDKWDRAPLLRVDHFALRTALDLSEDRRFISPLELSRSTLRDPRTDRTQDFLTWANQVRRRESKSFSTLERKSLELAGNYWIYCEHRMGRRLLLLPTQEDPQAAWQSLGQWLRAAERPAAAALPPSSRVRSEFLEMRAAYRQRDAKRFNVASSRWLDSVRGAQAATGSRPDQRIIDLEVAYYRWMPFRFAWVFSLAAVVCVALSGGTGWKSLYAAAIALSLASFAAILLGFGLRVGISGRAPVTNMFESVVYVALGVTLFGLILEMVSRRRHALGAAAAVSTVALVLADTCPAVLDASLRPLQPVLRNNFWLVTHVMTVTLSYAAFALAFGIGNLTLGHFIFWPQRRESIAALTHFNYRTIQVGVLLLATGTVLGGIWADYSWGRFWGWDPKEVWALITLLGYLAVLHARYVRWVMELGLATMSVMCFALVVMSWYGVNYVLSTGLHSYGFGDGGRTYVLTAVAVQFVFVAAAVGAASMRDGATEMPER